MTTHYHRPLLVALMLAAACGGILLAAPADAPAASAAVTDQGYLSRLPPLIDRQVFFGDPKIAGAQISPDGRFITFRKPYRDVMNIWIKGTDEPLEAARPLTADTARPVQIYFWSRDSRYVLYAQDKGGNENYHVYAVDPAADNGADGVPPARDLTPLEEVRAMIFAVPRATPETIVVGLNDRDPAAHDLYRVRLADGSRELIYRNEAGYAAFLVDEDGKLRLGWRMTPEGGSEITRLDLPEGEKAIYSCVFEESCSPLRFTPDGKKFYLTSDKGAGVDLQRLMLFDLESGKAELVESDPEGKVDFGGPIFSDRTGELLGTFYVGDRVRIYPRSKQLKRDLKLLKKKLPDGELSFGAGTADERRFIVSVSRDVNPGQVFLYDRKKRSVKKLYDSRPELPAKNLAPMRPVRIKARDGVEIPAYLTVPRGAEGTRIPSVILPHGGPWARDTWGYDALAQFLANRGYAVLQPNFRGSTGFGKRFLNGGNGGWGTGVMQHDLSDSVQFLVDQGIADPKRVAILGGSYGGYATLAGLAFTPDLYAAGVSIVGPSNIITLFESIPPYWAPIRKMFLLRVGDPDDPEDRERLVEQSPFFHARQIKAPLLVIQGANDPRVKKAESDQIVVALRELDRSVEYMVAPDEGHGFRGKENRVAMFAAIERFLGQHLGGRFQEEMRPEIGERLAELTVDPATVKMPQRAAGADAAATAPLPTPVAERIRPLHQSFGSTLSIPGGQELELKTERSVSAADEAGKAVWKVAAEVSGAMGSGRDDYLLDAQTLVPIHRSASQGPVSLELSFGAEKITGSIKTPGGEIPVDAMIDAPVFGEDAALITVFAALPLREGYKTLARTFDVQRQKVRRWSLEVEGTEKVATPAGDFETFRLRMKPLDDDGGGGTFWVTSGEPALVVKYEVSVPTPMGEVTGRGEMSAFELR